MKILAISFNSKLFYSLALFFVILLASKVLLAEEGYTSPQFSLPQVHHQQSPDIAVEEWDRGLRFRVQESPLGDRGLASDEEQAQMQHSRDPSSEVDPLKFEFHSDVRRWEWEDIEHAPSHR